MISWDGKCIVCGLDPHTHKEYIERFGFIRFAIPPKLVANFYTTDPLPLEPIKIEYKDCFRFTKPAYFEILDYLDFMDSSVLPPL